MSLWTQGHEVSVLLPAVNRAALLRALASGEIECEELLRLCRNTLIGLGIHADGDQSAIIHQRVQIALLICLLEGAVSENPDLLRPLEE